jgi:polyisoprenoid-binding protein YceI
MSATPTSTPAGTYGLDPVHSTFGFAVKHNGVSTFRGSFEQVDAKLADGVLTGTAQVDSVRTAIDDLKAHLLAPEFFNAEQIPTITFRSTDIRVADDGTAEVDGDLTIKGVTKPVTATGTVGHGIASRAPRWWASTSRSRSTGATTASPSRRRCPTARTPSDGTWSSRRISNSSRHR